MSQPYWEVNPVHDYSIPMADRIGVRNAALPALVATPIYKVHFETQGQAEAAMTEHGLDPKVFVATRIVGYAKLPGEG